MIAEPLPHDDVRPATSSPATLLFLHAFPLDRRMWRGQLARLGKSVRAIAVDLRGFGEARALERARSIEEMAADVASTIDALGLVRPIVVGLSMGGYVALALARLAEEKLGGLVLADTRAGADSAAARQGRAESLEKARRSGAAGVFAGMIPNVFAAGTRAAVVEELGAIAAEQTAEGVMGALEAMRDRPDATETLAWIAARALPTTVIVGAQDALTPPAEAERMSNAIPGAHLVVLAGAGHLSNVETPAAFDAALLAAAARVRI